MDRKLGCVPLGEGELGPLLTQCGQRRGLPACQVSSWYIQPFSRNTSMSGIDRQDKKKDRQPSDRTQWTVLQTVAQNTKTKMWANAQRDGRPAKYRWCPLFNAAKFGCHLLPSSNAAKTRKPLKFAQVPQTRQRISAVSGPKFTILWGHMDEVLLFNSFFPIVDTCLSCVDTARQNCAIVLKWRFFFVLYFERAECSTFQTCILNSH